MTKKIKPTTPLLIVLAFVSLYLAIWLFNHVNGWLGIAVFLIALYAYINIIFKYTNHK